MTRNIGCMLCLCAVLLLVPARNAYAYIDPGSGTLLWQFALAAFFGSLFFVRRAVLWLKTTLQWLWLKIKGSRRA